VLESVDPLAEQDPLAENVIVPEVLPPDAVTLVVSPRMKSLAVIESELWFALLTVNVTALDVTIELIAPSLVFVTLRRY
jgi:hypothetical protein